MGLNAIWNVFVGTNKPITATNKFKKFNAINVEGMNMKKQREITPLQSASAFALYSAYVSLVCGLKLDGYTEMPWVLLLAPVWFPIFAIFAAAFFFVLLAVLVNRLYALARTLRGRL